MIWNVVRGTAMVIAVLGIGACTTVKDILGVDSGHVQVSCSSSAPPPKARCCSRCRRP